MMMITRNSWYNNPEVLFNIVGAIKERETVFLSKGADAPPIRNIMANYSGFLKSNLDAFRFFERDYNLYYSLARYKRMQVFSFNPVIRKEQRLAWNDTAIGNTSSFDFGLDFDSEGLHDVMTAWNDCKKVKDLFDSYGVPYSLKFSGSKGFHITVPHNNLPNLRITSKVDDDMSLFNWLKSVATMLELKLGLPTLDMGIFDPRRIWKADYSWVCETGLIALPLSDEQFNNFNLSIVEPLSVIRGGIRNRGNLCREGKSDGFRAMVEDGLGSEWKELNSN